jgi:hypothetical protein
MTTFATGGGSHQNLTQRTYARASRRYAAQASGNVRAYAAGARIGATRWIRAGTRRAVAKP